MAISDMAYLNKLFGTANLGGRIVKQLLLFSIGLNDSEQIARLGEVVLIVIPEIVRIGSAVQFQRRLLCLGLFLPFAIAVWFIMFGAAIVAVHAHCPIAMEGVVRTSGFIYGNLIMVYAQSVPLRISVGKQPSLKHFVW